MFGENSSCDVCSTEKLVLTKTNSAKRLSTTQYIKNFPVRNTNTYSIKTENIVWMFLR